MRILWSLLREIPKWDTPSQIALLIAIILLVIDLSILSTVQALQTPALIGAVGLLLAIQAIFMWGNRTLVTPYTQAQRHFVAGEFEQVVAILKDYIETEEHPVIDALVLFGNAYRNLGQLHESEAVLRIALARRSDYHFALYGVGKIRLAKGDYQEAIKHIEKALQHGAPQTVQFDLAHAMLRVGDEDGAVTMLNSLPTFHEAYRELFKQYVQHVVQNTPPPSQELIELGLPFWQAEIDRFKHTPYGQAIRYDVEAIQNLK